MRSTKEAWLNGPGDLREEDVEDVPVPGDSVRVRGLSAKYSADVQGQLKLVTEGQTQVAKIDVAAMELLQFVHGVIEPQFTLDEARVVQEKFGPAFKKVIAVIDDISGIDKEAIEATEQRFPSGGVPSNGTPGSDEAATGDSRPDVPARVGA